MKKTRILLIQGRDNKEAAALEQQRYQRLLHGKGEQYEIIFKNALLDNAWDVIIPADYDGTVIAGTADLDFADQTVKNDFYLDRVAPIAQKVLNQELPGLGICYGHQVFAYVAGGKISRILERKETGTTDLVLSANAITEPIFSGFSQSIAMIFGHKDSVAILPPGATIIGTTEKDPHSALRIKNVITFQGHPEITNADELRTAIRLAHESGLEHYDLTYAIDDPDETAKLFTNFLEIVEHKR